MGTLTRSVGLAAAQEKQLLDDLKDWEKKGTIHLKPHQAMHLDPSQAFHCARVPGKLGSANRTSIIVNYNLQQSPGS